MHFVVIDVRDAPWAMHRRAFRQLPTFRRLARGGRLDMRLPIASADAPLQLLLPHPGVRAYGDFEVGDGVADPAYLDDADACWRAEQLMRSSGASASLVAWVLLSTVRDVKSGGEAWRALTRVDAMIAPLADAAEELGWTVALTASRVGGARTPRRQHVESFLCVSRRGGGERWGNLTHRLHTVVGIGASPRGAAGAAGAAVTTTFLDAESILGAQTDDVPVSQSRTLWIRAVVPRADRDSDLAVVLEFGPRDLVLWEELCTAAWWEDASEAQRMRLAAGTTRLHQHF